MAEERGGEVPTLDSGATRASWGAGWDHCARNLEARALQLHCKDMGEVKTVVLWFIGLVIAASIIHLTKGLIIGTFM